MKYSEKINLNNFFNAIQKEDYVIIKLSNDFPNYFKGNDLDIFCENINLVAKKILFIGNDYINKHNFIVEINKTNNHHCYIDFIFEDELELRFDLYDKLPDYQNLKLKNNLFGTILKNKIKKQKPNCLIYVPSLTEELILRYIEFLEWFDKRPDKIKHLNFILENASTPTTKEKFLTELHNYVKPYNNKNEVKIRKKQRLFNKIIKNKIKETLIKISNSFKLIKKLTRNFIEVILEILFKSKKNELKRDGIKKFVLKKLKLKNDHN